MIVGSTGKVEPTILILADYKNLLEKGAHDLKQAYLEIEELKKQWKTIIDSSKILAARKLEVGPGMEEGKKALQGEYEQRIRVIGEKQKEIIREMESKGMEYDERIKAKIGQMPGVDLVTPRKHAGKRKYIEFLGSSKEETKLKYAIEFDLLR